MKNYLVKSTRDFLDLVENVDRKNGDEFKCTKERYEYLESKNGAVILVNIEDEVTEEVVQAVAEAIVEEAKEQNKEVEEVIDDIIEEKTEDEVIEEEPKKKNKK